jgi:hypothetical protein
VIHPLAYIVLGLEKACLYGGFKTSGIAKPTKGHRRRGETKQKL